MISDWKFSFLTRGCSLRSAVVGREQDECHEHEQRADQQTKQSQTSGIRVQQSAPGNPRRRSLAIWLFLSR